MHSWISYGVPWEFFRIVKEGCFEEQEISKHFEILPLTIDVFIFILAGFGLYYGLSLVRQEYKKKT